MDWVLLKSSTVFVLATTANGGMTGSVLLGELTGPVLLGELVTPVCWRAVIEGGGIVRFAVLLVTEGQRYSGDVGVLAV